MDYEKAYKEALERAKGILCDGNCSDIEVIFPQLRESEDEKMMNQLHSWMKEFGGAEEYTEKVYQWLKGLLEKQKEQNEITIEQVYKEFINPEKLKDAKTNKYIRAQLLWELMHNGIITEVDYQYLTDDKRKPWTTEEYRIAYQKGFDMSEQLKQKEQKPAEWSEDDEEMAQFYSDDYNNRLGDKPMKWVLEMRLRFKEWLTTRLKSLRPQPQQNMSISFMLYLDEIRPEGKMCLSNGECNDIEDAFKKQDWPRLFKYINKYQPHWKPSEEEKGILLECASVLQNSGHWVLADKLLSLHLQSHWKPSEEQMKGLKFFLEFHRSQRNAGTTNWREYDAVESLYEQLKKLM